MLADHIDNLRNQTAHNQWSRLVLLPGLMLFALVHTAHAEDRVLSVIIDAATAQPGERGPAIDPWFWNKEQHEKALQHSQLSFTDVDGTRCMRIAVSKDLPWTRDQYDITATNGPDYLDPTCDAIRLRCRVVDGTFRLTLGGPTSYFANSDVLTAPVTLTPTTEWRDVVIPLDCDLSRNFRRAGLGAKNPIVSYTRWIQEGMRAYLHSGSQGVLLIQRMELLAQGRGQPYPVPPAGGLTAVGPVIAPVATDLFSAFIQRDLALTEQPKIPNRTWKPATASIDAASGRPAWSIRMQGTEEVSFAGCRLTVPAAAQALTMDISAGQIPRDPLSIDILFLVADGEVPWETLAAPPAWKVIPETAFSVFFTGKTTDSVSLALYHVRRAVPAKTTATVLIPWEDAVCIWGAGTCAESFLQQRKLQPERIRALLVTPSYRHCRTESQFTIAAIQSVALPADWKHLRSFFQPALSDLTSVHDPKDG
ncbi:MAG: hypothetical protein AAB263_17765, partial [Planctomycetota bacterium]